MTITGTMTAIERADVTRSNWLVRTVLAQERVAKTARENKIAALIADGRNPALTYEARYLAVMTLTAIEWRRRNHMLEGHIAPEEPAERVREIPSPRRTSMRLKKNDLPDRAAAAKLIGSRTYFTGKPCRHGHIAERYANNQTCVACSQQTLKRHTKAA